MAITRRHGVQSGAWEVTSHGELASIPAVHGDLAQVTGENKWYKFSIDSGTWAAEGRDSDIVSVNASLDTLDKVNIEAFEEVTTGSVAEDIGLNVYGTHVTTGSTEGNESLLIGDGTDAIIGQRKLIILVDRVHASDVVVLDHANIINAAAAALSAVALDAEEEFLLLEWNGTKWRVVHANATLTAA